MEEDCESFLDGGKRREERCLEKEWDVGRDIQGKRKGKERVGRKMSCVRKEEGREETIEEGRVRMQGRWRKGRKGRDGGKAGKSR